MLLAVAPNWAVAQADGAGEQFKPVFNEGHFTASARILKRKVRSETPAPDSDEPEKQALFCIQL